MLAVGLLARPGGLNLQQPVLEGHGFELSEPRPDDLPAVGDDVLYDLLPELRSNANHADAPLCFRDTRSRLTMRTKTKTVQRTAEIIRGMTAETR